MRSIMRTVGAPCAPDCKQQIDSSFVIWFGRKQVFWGGEIHFSKSKWTDQSLPSPGASSPASGAGRERERRSRPPSPLSRSFLFPCFLSALFAHLFPTLANTCSASKTSSCPFSPSRVCLSLSLSPVFLPWRPRCFAVAHSNPEKRRRRRRRRRSGEENRFHCFALMVFCV